jgi:hypothetical protein
VFDPLNLIGGSVAKSAKLRAWTPGAEKMFTKAVVTKGGKLAPTSKIVEDLSILGSKQGQLREAAGWFEKTRETFNLYGTRFQTSVVHRTAERIAQVPSDVFAVTKKSVLKELKVAGLAKNVDSVEFAAKVGRETSKRFQDHMMLWSQLASPNQDDVVRAAKQLSELGHGSMPTSLMGRRTALVLDRRRKDFQQSTSQTHFMIKLPRLWMI